MDLFCDYENLAVTEGGMFSFDCSAKISTISASAALDFWSKAEDFWDASPATLFFRSISMIFLPFRKLFEFFKWDLLKSS